MSIRNLDKIFKPERVAVIGASADPSKVGHTILKNLIGSGFSGVVYPVNPKRESVQGVQAYPDIASLPKTPDLAVICTPGSTVPSIVRECGEAGILGLIIVTAGFSEVDDEGKEGEAEIRAAAAEFDGMRIIGPNCLGVIVPGLKLNASFAGAMPKPGEVAFISQSGALCTAVLDLALEQNVGFSHFVSIGNMLDVSFADLIDYFGENTDSHSIIVYIESITAAREFMSAARAFARTKPIIAYKAGRFAESAAAAASHTGAMAGDDDVYAAAAQRAGIERVYELDDMFDCAELLSHHRLPSSTRLGIVTNAGGPGVMATDTLIARDGTLAELSHATIQQLNEALPPTWSHNNPVDVIGDAPAERFAEATRIVLNDEGVDAALVILTPQAMTDPTDTARYVGEIAKESNKPIIAAWMGGGSTREGTRILNHAGVPTYSYPEQAVHAFMHLVSYARNLEVLYETPRDIPVAFTGNREERLETCNKILEAGPEILSEPNSKALLEAYEIPVALSEPAATDEEAIAAARRMGYPVVLKILSPEITHKSDIGGVALNLRNDEEVSSTFERLVTTARARQPNARIEGVSVQPMISTKDGVELILGSKKDPTFGSVIMVGMGGVTAEIFKDFALGLPPLNERLARRMLESLKSCKLLKGYRNKPGVNIDRLIETIIRFSYLVAEHPHISEIDINPLLVNADNIVALDARVVLDTELIGKEAAKYSHLAIRPYPEQYVRHATLKDGEPVILRPIKPEDEPMWHDLLAACSTDSIRYRFFSVFKGTTHQMATRYCFIDYDREMAIVAEVQNRGERQLIGVGRLVADPDHDTAEYAILVADPAQGKGAGSLLTDFCLEVAEEWGVRRLTAEALSDNARVIHLLQSRGFETRRDTEEGLVYAEKIL